MHTNCRQLNSMMNWRYADFIRIFIYFYNTRNYIQKGKK